MKDNTYSHHVSTPKRKNLSNRYNNIYDDDNQNICENTEYIVLTTNQNNEINNESCSFDISKSYSEVLSPELNPKQNKKRKNSPQHIQLSPSIFSDLDDKVSLGSDKDGHRQKTVYNLQNEDDISNYSNKIKSSKSDKKEGSCTPSICNYYLHSNEVTPNKPDCNSNANSNCSNKSNDLRFNNIKQVNLNLVYNNMNFSTNPINSCNQINTCNPINNIQNDLTEKINFNSPPKNFNQNFFALGVPISPNSPKSNIIVNPLSAFSSNSNKHEHTNSGIGNTTTKRTPLKYTKAQCCGNSNDAYTLSKISKKNLMENFLATNVLNNVSESNSNENKNITKIKEKNLFIQNEDTLPKIISNTQEDNLIQIQNTNTDNYLRNYTGNDTTGREGIGRLISTTNENKIKEIKENKEIKPQSFNINYNAENKSNPKNISQSDYFIERQFGITLSGDTRATPKFGLNRLKFFIEENQHNNNQNPMQNDLSFMINNQSQVTHMDYPNGFKLFDLKKEKNKTRQLTKEKDSSKDYSKDTIIKLDKTNQNKSEVKERNIPKDDSNKNTVFKTHQKDKSNTIRDKYSTIEHSDLKIDLISQFRAHSAKQKKINYNDSSERKRNKDNPQSSKNKIDKVIKTIKDKANRNIIQFLEKSVYPNLKEGKISSSVGKTTNKSNSIGKNNNTSRNTSNSKGKTLPNKKKSSLILKEKNKINKKSSLLENNNIIISNINQTNTHSNKTKSNLSSYFTTVNRNQKEKNAESNISFIKNKKQKLDQLSSLKIKSKSNTKSKSKGKSNSKGKNNYQTEAIKINLESNKFTLENSKTNIHQKIKTQMNLNTVLSQFENHSHTLKDKKRINASFFTLNLPSYNDSKYTSTNTKILKALHTQETRNSTSTNNIPPNSSSTLGREPKVIQDFSFYKRKNKTKHENKQNKFKNNPEVYMKTETSISYEKNSLQNSQIESIKLEKLEGDNDVLDNNDNDLFD